MATGGGANWSSADAAAAPSFVESEACQKKRPCKIKILNERRMRITLIQTEIRSVRVEHLRRLDVVCDPMPSAKALLPLICKRLIDMLRKVLTRHQ